MQRRATKLILKLPFCCDVTYKTRLQLTNLLPIPYWHEFLDIVFFYKAVNNLVFINSEALPTTSINEIYQVIEQQCYYIFLSEVELLLINAHFSYARAAHGMFCPLSYAQVTSL